MESTQQPMVKPFTTKFTPKEKLYLILKVSEVVTCADNQDPVINEFEYFIGTTQQLYDALKPEIENADCKLDVEQSLVLVDSPNIRISHICTVAMFMKDVRDTGKVIDDTSFDINDYTYNTEGIDTPADTIRRYLALVQEREGVFDGEEQQ